MPVAVQLSVQWVRYLNTWPTNVGLELLSEIDDYVIIELMRRPCLKDLSSEGAEIRCDEVRARYSGGGKECIMWPG